MKTSRTGAAACLLVMLGVGGGGSVQAAEVIIYANQGAASGIADLSAAYEKETGIKVVIVRAAGAAFMEKINNNEPGDVVTGFMPGEKEDLVNRGKAAERSGGWVAVAGEAGAGRE